MSGGYDLLPVDWDLDLPEPVTQALLDLGMACATAELALGQAFLLERQAGAAEQQAQIAGPAAPHRRQYAAALSECTMSYADQLTVAYAISSAVYASYAVHVAAEIGAGRRPSPACPEAILPSGILRQPQRYVPLVQLTPRDVDGDPIVEQNEQLAEDHRHLGKVIDGVLASDVVTVYDDPSQVANRPPRSVSLVVQFPEALHRYATSCVLAIGLATRRDSITQS